MHGVSVDGERQRSQLHTKIPRGQQASIGESHQVISQREIPLTGIAS